MAEQSIPTRVIDKVGILSGSLDGEDVIAAVFNAGKMAVTVLGVVVFIDKCKVFLLGDLTTMPSRFASGVFAGVVCGVLTLVTKPFLSPMVSLLSPVLAVNFLSFVLDFFSKTMSRRKIRSREVDVS